MAKATKAAESRSAAPLPDARTPALRIGLLLSPFLLNDFLYFSAAGQSEPLRTWIDLLTSLWAASLLFLAWRLRWWNPSTLPGGSGGTYVRQALVGVSYGAGILFVSIPVRLLIWLGGRFWGFDLPFPGAWSGFESEPVLGGLRILFVCILGAIIDETSFRGAALQLLRYFNFDPVRYSLIGAGLYAAAHWSGGPLLWITAFGLGLLWTYLFQRIGLLGTIVAHAVFDLVTAFGMQQALVGAWIAE